MTKYQQKLLALLPPVSYDTSAIEVQDEMLFDSLALEHIERNAARIVDALHPAKNTDVLTDYERVYGVSAGDNPTSKRIENVLAQINATGGLSIPYFVALAAAAGVTITISEPQPFRAGVSSAGDALWPEDAVYIWLVNVVGGNTGARYFRAGMSSAGESLAVFEKNNLETLFRKLKPAHTQCYFT